MSERMFTFSTNSQKGATVRCHACGWTARGRTGKTVFPKADAHVCPTSERGGSGWPLDQPIAFTTHGDEAA
ncbi:MAG TPA: hypothetical protein VGW38_24250 [Chloroflexota bacterium]|nr:hypothetical protein [Chloroflexota bacterium]